MKCITETVRSASKRIALKEVDNDAPSLNSTMKTLLLDQSATL
jgi:hypothetical protein